MWTKLDHIFVDRVQRSYWAMPLVTALRKSSAISASRT